MFSCLISSSRDTQPASASASSSPRARTTASDHPSTSADVRALASCTAAAARPAPHGHALHHTDAKAADSTGLRFRAGSPSGERERALVSCHGHSKQNAFKFKVSCQTPHPSHYTYTTRLSFFMIVFWYHVASFDGLLDNHSHFSGGSGRG